MKRELLWLWAVLATGTVVLAGAVASAERGASFEAAPTPGSGAGAESGAEAPEEAAERDADPAALKIELGRRLFNATWMSEPDGQSCATCHSPAAAFSDPQRQRPVSAGALKDRVNLRNAPSLAYASFTPSLHYNTEDETYVGGLFLDGRVDGLAAQAVQPLLDPLEMHNPGKVSVVRDLRRSTVAPLFKQVYGAESLEPFNTDAAFAQVADAIAAFEASPEMNPFTSKYDYYLKGQARLSPAEERGLQLFNGKANCCACHPSNVVGDEPGPLFTDFTYDNIGTPKNWNSPFLTLPARLNPHGLAFIDYGLMNTILGIEPDPEKAAAEAGKFKVTTLRNVELTAPYGHNGYFQTLKQVVRFYSTRDDPAEYWPPAEVLANVNRDEMGSLGLTPQEEDDLVAFLLTLTDGYRPDEAASLPADFPQALPAGEAPRADRQ